MNGLAQLHSLDSLKPCIFVKPSWRGNSRGSRGKGLCREAQPKSAFSTGPFSYILTVLQGGQVVPVCKKDECWVFDFFLYLGPEALAEKTYSNLEKKKKKPLDSTCLLNRQQLLFFHPPTMWDCSLPGQASWTELSLLGIPQLCLFCWMEH